MGLAKRLRSAASDAVESDLLTEAATALEHADADLVLARATLRAAQDRQTQAESQLADSALKRLNAANARESYLMWALGGCDAIALGYADEFMPDESHPPALRSVAAMRSELLATRAALEMALAQGRSSSTPTNAPEVPASFDAGPAPSAPGAPTP